jgi:hypothetical protein
MTETCGNCARLQAEVARLEGQVTKLKRENKRLRALIASLRRAIQNALYYLGRAGSILFAAKLQADEILSQKSGVSPRRWGFALGVRWLHDNVAPPVSMAIYVLKQAIGG